MEGFPISLDVIFHHICPYLSLWDLRRAMRVSRSWFFTMISDGAFAHFKTKILRNNPELQVIFDEHLWEYGDERTALSMRPSKGKKHRKAWIMPKGGSWYVMKKLSKGRTIGGLRKLISCGNTRIVFAVIKRMLVPVEKDHMIESINEIWGNDDYYNYKVVINGRNNYISIPKKGFQILLNAFLISSNCCFSAFNNSFSLSDNIIVIRNRKRYSYAGIYAELMTNGV